jgi:two-component system alkaline phosphatase synthesis response regulator PhoP/two-component system response regulator VicR
MAHKILVIDDEENLVLLIKRRLEANGYLVVTARNGREGLEQTLSQKPNLIITDVLMPEMTGYEMARQIRAKGGALATIPIIVITAKASMKDFFEAFNDVSFCQKPFDQQKLLDQIDGYMHKHGVSNGQAQTMTRPVEQSLSAEKPVTKTPPAQPAENITVQPAAKSVPGTGNVVLVGMDEYVLEKLRHTIAEKGYQVHLMYDENETIQMAESLKPKCIFIQFWEDSARFDATKIFNFLMSQPTLKSIPIAIFCVFTLEMDAYKNMKTAHIIGYSQSSDLLTKVQEFLDKNVK